MAASVYTDFRILDEHLHRGVQEEMSQRVNAFNEETFGCIRLIDERVSGHFEHNVLWKDLPNAIAWRDIASTAAVADSKIDEIDEIAVKINRRIVPHAATGDALRKSLAGFNNDLEQWSANWGQRLARNIPKDMLNTALLAATAAIRNQASNLEDQGGTGTITSSMLPDALYRMGDAAERVKCWIMHSKVFKDLLKEQITTNRLEVTAFALFEGAPATLNKPVFITDSPNLIVAGTPNEYLTLGLVEDGIVLKNAEEEDMLVRKVDGLHQILYRIQGEFAYTIQVKGFQWDTTNGGINPQDAAVGTGTNWDIVASSNKSLAGVVLQTQ